MSMIRIILILGILLAGIGVVWKIAPAKSKLILLSNRPHFPIVSGYNLNRQEFIFPRDFFAENNFVIVPFQQYQQRRAS